MNWKYIMIHCTATPADRRTPTIEIDTWHRKRGFRSIGYHFVVHQDGTVDKGRSLEKSGAHCIGYNDTAIGIAYVGGLDKHRKPADTRTPRQREAILQLIKEIRKYYRIERIMGHNEVSNKACPCFDVRKEGYL